jgi:hypothetical protein
LKNQQLANSSKQLAKPGLVWLMANYQMLIARATGADNLAVILPRGFHPFPSRTRKLSPAGPIVLRAKVRGRVGRRRIKIKGHVLYGTWPFLFPLRSAELGVRICA